MVIKNYFAKLNFLWVASTHEIFLPSNISQTTCYWYMIVPIEMLYLKDLTLVVLKSTTNFPILEKLIHDFHHNGCL